MLKKSGSPSFIDTCESSVETPCEDISFENFTNYSQELNNMENKENFSTSKIIKETFQDNVLHNVRVKNPNRIIIGQLNINSLRNKIEMLQEVVKNNIDILLISETKLDSSYPDGQFLLKHFSSPIRLDRNANGGGLLLYIREDIPCKVLNKHSNDGNFESLFIELNLKSKRWLLSCSYNPNKTVIEKHLKHLSNGIDCYSPRYDNYLLFGDFNAEISNEHVEQFCATYNLRNLVKQPTCFISVDNPSCIDLILTNHPKCFQNSGTYETGLSDFHLLVYSVLKICFEKKRPIIVNYRDYKRFDNTKFREKVLVKFSENDNISVENQNYKETIRKIIDELVPLKEKHLRNNDAMFMNKLLRKAIMKRSRLLNRYRRKKDTSSRLAYKKQHNFCVKLLGKSKKDFYNNLDVKYITDNKLFWKTVKPCFSDKTKKNRNITLVREDKIISEDKDLAKVFNDHFCNIVEEQNIEVTLDQDLEHTPVFNAIRKYKDHPSIIMIMKNMKTDNSFKFEHVSIRDIEIEIENIDTSKAFQNDDIPSNIIKQNCDIFSRIIHNQFNNSLETSVFPEELKNADVIPVFKKGSRNDIENYRPVSILPNISKIFERCIYKQLYSYFDNFLSKYQTGFRKGYSTQQCLLAMIEKLKESIDNKGVYAALLTDLSKAFDCLPHDLLIAKLHAYGVELNALNFLCSYLTNRYQRVKINNSFSEWSEIIYGVPQGSILGPLLFNIFLSDLFLFLPETTFASYADDNTPFLIGKDVKPVLDNLERVSNAMLKWFSNNGMKANPDKYHLLSNCNTCSLKVGNEIIENNECEKLLGIKIDKSLNFNTHVESLCKKAGQKINALSRLTFSLNFDQRRLIMNSFIMCHFSYCPVVWMFHSRKLNNRINRLHERVLRIIYKDYNSSFDDLRSRDNALTIHQRNIHKLMIEIFKVKIGASPEIMEDLFHIISISYNLRQDLKFKSRNIRTVRYGSETASFLGPALWNSMPSQLKSLTSINEFKLRIKKWIPDNCPCNLCKAYIPQLGYI